MNTLYREAEQVRKAIRAYGGSFMQALGNAMDYADVHNLAKIRETWIKEWDQYLEMAEIMDRKDRENRDEGETFDEFDYMHF